MPETWARAGPPNPAATPASPVAVVAVWVPWPLLSRAERNSPGRGAIPEWSKVFMNRWAPISLWLQAKEGSLGLADPNWQVVPCHFAGGAGEVPASAREGGAGQTPGSTLPPLVPS